MIHLNSGACRRINLYLGRTPDTTPRASAKGNLQVSDVNGITVVTEDTRALVRNDYLCLCK